MKTIATTEAEGCILCHDITQIIIGETKETRFRKGHVVTAEDIPVLLSIGKDNLYVWEADDTVWHENEAAEILYGICKNAHMRPSEVKEGKIDIYTETAGYFMADKVRMQAINGLGEIMIATRQSDTPVQAGDKLAGTRVIPLVIRKGQLEKATDLGNGIPLLAVHPYRLQTAGIVTTGNEVFFERIKDTFGPVLRDKLAEYGVKVKDQRIVGDDQTDIAEAILSFAREGVDLIVCTGGMSVDPDDRTPAAIRQAGTTIISYGAPVLPGAMFLMGYLEYEGRTIPVMGLPGCVMYSRRTIFDLVLPRVLAEIPVTTEWLAALGNGGLCLNCEVCTYPNCGFGK